jgi:hypothetical protein
MRFAAIGFVSVFHRISFVRTQYGTFISNMLRKHLTLIVVLFTLIINVTGCAEPTTTTQAVDPTFQEFYNSLGGQDILGPIISVMYDENGRKLQFTSKALMTFSPGAPESAHYQLAPLGVAMQVAESPLSPTSPNGLEIYAGFLPLFHQLGGTRITGQPITSVKADPEKGRIVQYFENVGFYQLESDPPDVAHLLDYGVWKCAQACSYQSSQDSIVIPPSSPGYGITESVDRLDSSLTGYPLTEIYIATDGKQEQIFENVVIYTDAASPGGISLRKLPKLLEISQELPTPAGEGDGKFITVDGDYGFNVPYHVDEYIERNNGYDFIGKPITNYKQISDNLYRQCFEKLCLDYRPDEIEVFQISPMPLGRRYKQQYFQPNDSRGTNSFEAVTLTVWEQKPVISSSEYQEIYVMVLDEGKPLQNIDLILRLTLPDGNQQEILFPPTNTNGQTWVTLEPIDASIGTVIVYEVCLENVQNGPDCVTDDYLIWGNS